MLQVGGVREKYSREWRGVCVRRRMWMRIKSVKKEWASASACAVYMYLGVGVGVDVGVWVGCGLWCADGCGCVSGGARKGQTLGRSEGRRWGVK